MFFVLLYELAHCTATESSVCEYRYHGNAFLKLLERFYEWDPHADFYMPVRQSNVRIPFVYRYMDDYFGKSYKRKTASDRMQVPRRPRVFTVWRRGHWSERYRGITWYWWCWRFGRIQRRTAYVKWLNERITTGCPCLNFHNVFVACLPYFTES